MLLRTSARSLALSGVLLLGAATLAGCGEDESSAPTGGGLDTVSVSGETGTPPEVTFDGKLDGAELESEVLVEGDGAEVEDGDNVLAHLWIGNGFTEQQAYSTYDAGKPELLSAGGDLSAPLAEAVSGHTIGSRVAVLASAEDSFGEGGNPQLGIANKDAVLWIVDLVSEVAGGPSGEEKTPAKWAPDLVEGEDGTITGFDFASTNHEPGGKLLSTTLVKGDGPAVKKGQTIYVDYLGQVFGGKEPFDESYSTGQPASFPIGVGQVVKGWDQALVGKPVGSRLVLEIPPALGYGKTGNEQAGIKGTDTLVFVVDILGAS